jgi:hypothetical protein
MSSYNPTPFSAKHFRQAVGPGYQVSIISDQMLARHLNGFASSAEHRFAIGSIQSPKIERRSEPLAGVDVFDVHAKSDDCCRGGENGKDKEPRTAGLGRWILGHLPKLSPSF